jgi:hypothetical protein
LHDILIFFERNGKIFAVNFIRERKKAGKKITTMMGFQLLTPHPTQKKHGEKTNN